MIAPYTSLPSSGLADHRIRADLEARRQIPKTRNIFKISHNILQNFMYCSSIIHCQVMLYQNNKSILNLL